MRIAIMDYRVVPTNPIGGCHLRMLRQLCDEHEFTVFAIEFENPCPSRIRFVPIPVPRRPLALLFLGYHLMAPLIYWAHRIRHRLSFDLVQTVESNCSIGDVAYTHFCHRGFLRRYWKVVGGRNLRGRLRWLDHWFHALLEPAAYRRARDIIVPSCGLARELGDEFPYARQKITVLPNPVDLQRLVCPAAFDRQGFRSMLGFAANDVVLVFGALGHFERKGLPLLFEAMELVAEPTLKLMIVGGEDDLVASYRKRAATAGLGGRVHFAGLQQDARPYLWSADALAFPSYYEAFPLMAVEAAGAGLPLLVPPLHGVEDYLQDGANGFLVGRSAEGVAEGVRRLLALTPEARRHMGDRARAAVARYDTAHFIQRWREFYARRALA
jgi:glycosyltransferase involved in cell wall biosynthesis